MQRPGSIICSLLIGVALHCQSTEPKWSSLRLPVTTDEMQVLVDVELKMYDSALTSGGILIFEGFNQHFGYHIRMSKMATSSWLHDSLTSKLKFVPVAELVTIWNTAADSFSILGFQAMTEVQREYRSAHLKWTDTSCHVHVPLAAYVNCFDRWRVEQIRNICLQSLACWMSGKLNGDTIERVLPFYAQGKNYLPQADYLHLARVFEDGMLIGKLATYSSDKLSKRLSKNECERLSVTNDSTFRVEDPKNPGKYIIVPIRRQAQRTGIIVSEKWIPDTGYFSNLWPYFSLPMFRSYKRVVNAYGLCYDNGKIAWFDPGQVTGYCSWPTFNWLPYEESFRAERYETMQIDLIH